MKAIRARLGLDEGRESGMTLVEVVVAMFIFAIISTGVLYTMLSAIAVTRDSRAKHIAANLAAQEIDLARASADLFALTSTDKTVALNGDTYAVHIDTNWVPQSAADQPCGTGGGQLLYKRVNVSVTWGGMRAGTQPVRADTVVNPANRLNDPTKGTILVSVLNSTGKGTQGVTVSASATSGGGPVASKSTDVDGCAYLLQVEPGTYTVKIDKSGYVTEKQEATPVTQTAVVTAGTSASVGFQFDKAAKFSATLASNGTNQTILPTTLPVSWVSSYGTYAINQTGTAPNKTRATGTKSLHPFADGYQVMAGSYVAPAPGNPGCVAPDPAAWPSAVVGGGTLVGYRAGPTAALPGDTAADLAVPMGLVTITGSWGSPSNSNYLRAESVSPQGADPGCSSTIKLAFGKALPTSTGTITIALPYGTWKLYSGTNDTTSTNVITPASVVAPSTINGDKSVTLDPRVLVP